MPERIVQLSVLDRLIDEETGKPTLTWVQSLRLLKEGLRRDLEWLLNTRRIAVKPPPHLEEVEASLYNYGLPDISSRSADSEAERERLIKEIKATIAIFEPRIYRPSVTYAQSEKKERLGLRFQIEGLIRMDPADEPVYFDTMLDTAARKFKVVASA